MTATDLLASVEAASDCWTSTRSSVNCRSCDCCSCFNWSWSCATSRWSSWISLLAAADAAGAKESDANAAHTKMRRNIGKPPDTEPTAPATILLRGRGRQRAGFRLHNSHAPPRLERRQQTRLLARREM